MTADVTDPNPLHWWQGFPPNPDRLHLIDPDGEQGAVCLGHLDRPDGLGDLLWGMIRERLLEPTPPERTPQGIAIENARLSLNVALSNWAREGRSVDPLVVAVVEAATALAHAVEVSKL